MHIFHTPGWPWQVETQLGIASGNPAGPVCLHWSTNLNDSNPNPWMLSKKRVGQIQIFHIHWSAHWLFGLVVDDFRFSKAKILSPQLTKVM
jgi:hypothetical protein